MWEKNEEEVRNIKNELKAVCIKYTKIEKKYREQLEEN